jgi:hypothetical protein
LGVTDGRALIEPLPWRKPGAKYAVLARIAIVWVPSLFWLLFCPHRTTEAKEPAENTARA